MEFSIENSRIAWVDWAKSISMFLVVLGHCHIRESEQFVIQYIYSFHMMLFFFLSGLLCKRGLSVETFKKDFKYLILPYFTYGLVLVLFYFLRLRSFDYLLLLSKFIDLVVGLDAGIGPIWFLPALFLCKQMYYFVKKVKNVNIVLYYVLVVFSLLGAYFISSYNINSPLFSDSALCGLPFFIMGNESFLLWNKLSQYNIKLRLLLIFVLMLISVVLCYFNGFVVMANCLFGKSILLYYANSLSAIASIILLCALLESVQYRFVVVASRCSIVVLGIHSIPLIILNYYFPLLFGIEPSTYSFFMAFIYSVVVYVICYLFFVNIAVRYPIFWGVKGFEKK